MHSIHAAKKLLYAYQKVYGSRGEGQTAGSSLVKLLMVLYKKDNATHFQMMTEAELAGLLGARDQGVEIMDAFVYMLYDNDTLSSEDLIFRKEVSLGETHDVAISERIEFEASD